MDPLAGRVAVITGAGSGFGREFARLGHRNGMKLVLADVQRDALEATLAELRAAGATAIAEVVDVARSEQVQALADRAYREFGQVHLLFNNAGVGGGGYVWESTERDWQWVLGVNVMGVVHGLRHFVPRMLAANRAGEPGHIVNTASMAGWVCAPLMGVYNASKHAVVALTETLYHDLRLADSTIGVSLLCPAFVPTGITQSERNRPDELANEGGPTESQRVAQQQTAKAVSAGKISAAEVAQMTFDAIRADRFFVFTHPKILPTVEERYQAALRGAAPADPFASKPQARPPSPL
ncbi:MAG TPA: SDR family oxidoreductase [Burkholderiaceae bacterium]|nr:SDR family oxidoreductase [Burkholderiaceae bacterium]